MLKYSSQRNITPYALSCVPWFDFDPTWDFLLELMNSRSKDKQQQIPVNHVQWQPIGREASTRLSQYSMLYWQAQNITKQHPCAQSVVPEALHGGVLVKDPGPNSGQQNINGCGCLAPSKTVPYRYWPSSPFTLQAAFAWFRTMLQSKMQETTDHWQLRPDS
jgi:hypothetical protein